MKLKSNFALDLNFKPLTIWGAAVPAIALNNQLLSGFSLSANHPVYSYDFKSFDEALHLFKSLYPALTLPELARFLKSPGFANLFQAPAVLKAYNLKDSSDTWDVMDRLVQSSEDFQNFVSLKKISVSELLPLTSLNAEQQKWIEGQILSSEESRQESIKRLELLADLLLLNQAAESLQNLSLQALTEKRYPVTTLRDQTLQSQNLPWSQQIKTQFKRQGDKAGFEVRFFAGTPAELNKLAQNLSKVAAQWNESR